MEQLDELRALILRHTGSSDTVATALAGVTLAVAGEPTSGRAGFAEPSVAIVAGGVKRTVLNGTAYDYRAGQFLVVSVELPVVGHVLEASSDEPFAVVSMRLQPTVIAGLLLEAANGGRLPAFSGLAVSDATRDLLDPVLRLLRLLEHPRDAPVLAAAFEREITWRLITGEQGAVVRQIGLADSSLAHVSRAIRFIRDHFDETLRVEEVASLAGMSVSSLHRHFRAATSMTPVQFQKQIRLQHARALLLTHSADVAEAGYLSGYNSPSQFSREYRRAFGAPPGRDAIALSAAPAFETV